MENAIIEWLEHEMRYLRGYDDLGEWKTRGEHGDLGKLNIIWNNLVEWVGLGPLGRILLTKCMARLV